VDRLPVSIYIVLVAPNEVGDDEHGGHEQEEHADELQAEEVFDELEDVAGKAAAAARDEHLEAGLAKGLGEVDHLLALRSDADGTHADIGGLVLHRVDDLLGGVHHLDFVFMACLTGELVPKFRREADAAAILVEGEGFEVSRGDAELGGWRLRDGIRKGDECGEE
jgi:hypothetical protein